MSGSQEADPVKLAQAYEPHKDYAFLKSYAPKYGKAEHVGEALKHTKSAIDIYDKTAEFQLEIGSELKSLIGKDYLDKTDKKKIDDVADKLKKLSSEKVLKRYFGTKEDNKKLAEYLSDQFSLTMEQIKSAIDEDGRVNYQQIDNLVNQSVAKMRGQLLQPIYNELQRHDKKEVALETGSMLHYYIGGLGAGQNVSRLKRHKTSAQVTSEIAGLDEMIASQMTQAKRRSEPEGKGGKTVKGDFKKDNYQLAA